MRYHYEKPRHYTSMYGVIYACDHLVYDQCTLYLIENLGLAVIQQRYDPDTKRTWWGEIDPWLVDSIYLAEGFKQFFDVRAGLRSDGHYPTVTVRQIMHALRMKPLPRARWETCFDRRDI